MTIILISLALELLMRTVVLTALLWIMIKLQQLNYFFMGLLGSAILASGLDMIPYFGHYLAVPILYYCIWKVTRSTLVDSVFTVAISYALMFLVKMCVITALLVDLRGISRAYKAPDDEHAAPVLYDKAESTPEAVTNQLYDPNKTALGLKNAKIAADLGKKLKLKGITQNGSKSMALIGYQGKTYAFYQGEPISLMGDDGPIPLKLAQVGLDWVNLEFNSEPIVLKLK